jgi:hypothetical protein
MPNSSALMLSTEATATVDTDECVFTISLGDRASLHATAAANQWHWSAYIQAGNIWRIYGVSMSRPIRVKR